MSTINVVFLPVRKRRICEATLRGHSALLMIFVCPSVLYYYTLSVKMIEKQENQEKNVFVVPRTLC